MLRWLGFLIWIYWRWWLWFGSHQANPDISKLSSSNITSAHRTVIRRTGKHLSISRILIKLCWRILWWIGLWFVTRSMCTINLSQMQMTPSLKIRAADFYMRWPPTQSLHCIPAHIGKNPFSLVCLGYLIAMWYSFTQRIMPKRKSGTKDCFRHKITFISIWHILMHLDGCFCAQMQQHQEILKHHFIGCLISAW